MARIHLLSDLHLEYEDHSLRDHRAPEGTDVVVLAGDTHPGVLGVMWAARCFEGLPVLYVPGNHEYYGKRGFRRHLERMREKAAGLGGGVRVCDRDEVVVAGTRFLLATLWTDYALHGTPGDSMEAARARMNDYRMVTVDGARSHPISPANLLSEHLASREFLEAALARPFDGPTVVVTHHAPSPSSLPPGPEGKDEDVAPCYASDLEGLIHRGRPELWFHGHIHQGVDYEVGETRVLSNPRGWVSRRALRGVGVERENPGWNPGMLVDSEARPLPRP